MIDYDWIIHIKFHFQKVVNGNNLSPLSLSLTKTCLFLTFFVSNFIDRISHCLSVFIYLFLELERYGQWQAVLFMTLLCITSYAFHITYSGDTCG